MVEPYYLMVKDFFLAIKPSNCNILIRGGKESVCISIYNTLIIS